MKQLSKSEFEKLTANALVLSKDRHGLKVLETQDGRIFKLFRLKRTFSSAQFSPYVTRFAKNAAGLQQRSIPTINVLDFFKVPELQRDVVIYKPLVGRTLRDQVASDGPDCLAKLPSFLAQLHRRGIFFRSIHFGNIIVRPDESFGLIDISDLKLRKRELWIWERVRNFRHLCKYESDKDAVTQFGIERFLEGYIEASKLDGIRRRIFRRLIIRLF